MLQIAEHHKF